MSAVVTQFARAVIIIVYCPNRLCALLRAMGRDRSGYVRFQSAFHIPYNASGCVFLCRCDQ